MRIAKLFFCGLAVVASLPLRAQVVLEDFSSLRKDIGGSDLWSAYLGEDPDQTYSLVNGTLQVVGSKMTGCNGTGCGVYMNFFPRGVAGYDFPNGFMQNYVKAGSFDQNTNRLRFRVQCTKNVARRTDGGSMTEVGTYIKSLDNTQVTVQGTHYYHILNFNMYANRWINVELNRVPQHQVGMDPSTNWPEDPEYVKPNTSLGNYTPVHYYSGLTRFYFDTTFGAAGPDAFSGETCTFADFMLDTVAGEPDALVSSVTSTYSGSAYEVSWAGPKNLLTQYEIRYNTSSFKSTGFTGGTDGGKVSSNGNAYTGVFWSSPAMPETQTLYVAIRPAGQSAFKEVMIQQRPTTPQTFSPCDVNRDGVVNASDVQIASQAAVGLSACTADLNGDGKCNLVDVQRVSLASQGFGCKITP